MTYKEKKTARTLRRSLERAEACNCYLEGDKKMEEKHSHDPFCAVWDLGVSSRPDTHAESPNPASDRTADSPE